MRGKKKEKRKISLNDFASKLKKRVVGKEENKEI